MSRQIKFRAWDVKYKEMLQVFRTDSHPDLIAPHSVIAGTAGGGHIVSRPLLNLQGQEPEFILMQFTGLKDKDGVEMYGGDGIAITAAKDMFNEDGSLSMKEGELYENAIISFSNGAFWLGYGCLPEKHLLKMILNDGNWRGKIIGNIHTTPKLLETE